MIGFSVFPDPVSEYSTFGGNLRIDFPSDNAVAFKLPQMLGEHLLRYAVQAAAQLTKAAHAGEQLAQNQKLPLPADDAEGSFRGTKGGLFYRAPYLPCG